MSDRASTSRCVRVLRQAAVLAMAAVGVAGTAAPAATAPAAVDWDTYGFDVSRGGANPDESAINPTSIHGLHQAWSFELGSVIDTEPLLAARVFVPVSATAGQTKDLVIAGSENGNLGAVDAANGHEVWVRHLGYVNFPSCDNLPHYGVTGTPAIDRATNSVYAAGGTGYLYRLDLATGRTEGRWRLTRDPAHNHVWGALTVFGGRVYVELAGNCDDPPYHGEVVSINPQSGAMARWLPTGRSQGGGVWGWGGIAVDPRAGAVYAAVGNSLSPPSPNEHVGYAERVVRLTPGLRVQSSNFPGLPATGDADFGATPLIYQAPGCPPQLAVGNKFGHFYVYDRDHIGQGPVQTISLGGAGFEDTALLGVGAYSPGLRTLYLANPKRLGRYAPGMLAFHVGGDCRLAPSWQSREPTGRTTDPVVAGNVVFYAVSHRVIAVDARSGKRLWISRPSAIRGPMFDAPTVVNGVLYAGAWDGRLHAFTL